MANGRCQPAGESLGLTSGRTPAVRHVRPIVNTFYRKKYFHATKPNATAIDSPSAA
jgi:hypothetical protein